MSGKPQNQRLGDAGQLPRRDPGGVGGPGGPPPELAALEAALAGLVPRADRLDPDRLLFLAGQASAAGRSPRRWHLRALEAWAAGMTAVAVLLALLLVHAERRLERTAQRGPAPGLTAPNDRASELPPPPPDLPNRRAGPRPPRPDEPFPIAAAPPYQPAPLGNPAALSSGDWTRFGSRSEYLVMLDRLLRAGADAGPTFATTFGHNQRKDEMVLSYRQWLEILLDDPAQPGASGGQAEMPLPTGTNS